MKYFNIIFTIIVGIFLFPITFTAKNLYTVTIQQNSYIKSPVIEYVTVDTNNYNKIVWIKQENDKILYYNVYRSTDNKRKDWELIGKINYKSQTSIYDLNSYAQVQSYWYCIAAVDRCGNEFFSNSIFRSIHLAVKYNGENRKLLEWNSYEGNQVDVYYIYKGLSPICLVLVDSVGSSVTDYEDTDTIASNQYYQIEAKGFTIDENVDESRLGLKSNTNNKYIRSVSNIAKINYDSILRPFDDEDLLIYPNPLVSSSLIKFPFDPTQKYQLQVLDMLGKIVYEQGVDNGEFVFYRGLLKDGIYIFQISGKQSIHKKLLIGKSANYAN